MMLTFYPKSKPLLKSRPFLYFSSYSSVKAFQDVFDRNTLNQYGSEDIQKRYQQLPPSSKATVDKVLNKKQLTHDDVAQYYENGQLGLLEEYADLLSEYQIYRMAKKGILNETQIYSWENNLKRMKAENQPFSEIKQWISESIRPEQYKGYQALSGLTNPRLCNELLVINYLKFALWQLKENERLVLTHHAREHFISEANELLDVLKPRPLSRGLMRTYLHAMLKLEPFFGDRLLFLPLRWVQKRLNLPTLKQDDLVQYLIFKQNGRYELHYSSSLGYEQRKMVLKPFEALFEANLLKQLKINQKTSL